MRYGFTLVEVMIAVTILAVGMIGVIRAYAAMVNTLEAADCSIESACILKERMFRAGKKAIEEGNLLPRTERGKIKGKYGDFEWRTAVSEIDSSLEEYPEGEEPEESEDELVMYLKEVRVTVSNEGVTPVRKFTVVGYVEGYAEAEPTE